MIGRPAGYRRRRNADPQLLALRCADGIATGVWRAENVEDQRLAIPGAERIQRHAFGAVGGRVAGFSGFGFHWVIGQALCWLAFPGDRIFLAVIFGLHP